VNWRELRERLGAVSTAANILRRCGMVRIDDW